MLQNAYFLAKIGADTAENEQHFAEILPIGRRVAVALGEKRSMAVATSQVASSRSAGIRRAPRRPSSRAALRGGRTRP